jgi:hypothetical protein
MPTVRGVIGSVRWGYHRAADVRSWVVTRDKHNRKVWHLTAQVVRADPFLGARSELVFVAPLKGGRAWQWPVHELAIANGRARALLGDIETTARGIQPVAITREIIRP